MKLSPFSMWLCLGLGTALLLVSLPGPAEAGCRHAKMCCAGKNISCRAPLHTPHDDPALVKEDAAETNALEAAKSTSPRRSCFCDEHCIHVGDCCEDYQDHCKAVDCVLGDWGAWGKCSKDCGWGSKERRRPVMIPAKNGGKKCNTSVEKTFCYGEKCKTARHSSSTLELRETAKIIPAMYGRWRKNKLYNPYQDIRRNLFHHYSANQIIRRPAYCAKFEITRARGSCFITSNPWSRSLKKGLSVCVECQQLAMKRKLGVRCKGHGVYLKETRWNAMTVPGCHGKWMMTSQHEECTCNPAENNAFILI